MTDINASEQLQKISPITQDAVPEFPVSRRGGYLEDAVDQWLTTHYEEIGRIIEYQRYSVDVLEAAQARLAVAEEAANTADARVADAVARAVAAEERVAELEEHIANTPVAEEAAPVETVEETQDFASEEEAEAFYASRLLQNAARLANEHVDSAKADAEQIRSQAYQDVVDLHQQKEELNGEIFATRNTLIEFFENQLGALHANPIFAVEEEEAVEETPEYEEDIEAEVAEEAPEYEEDVVVEEEISSGEENVVDPSQKSNEDFLDELDENNTTK